MDQATQTPKSDAPSPDERRGFLQKAAAVVIGALVGLGPLAAGVVMFLDPLSRKKEGSKLLKVTMLDAVPDDDIPRRFQITADRSDLWNLYRDEPVGAVYLRRKPGSSTVECLHATCPHLGCSVDYIEQKQRFTCPCHASHFEQDGARIDPSKCPSPRDLDSLVVNLEKLKVNEVWVEYQDFKTAISEKVAKG